MTWGEERSGGKKKTPGVSGEEGEVQRSGKDERPSLIASEPGAEPRPDPQDRQRGGEREARLARRVSTSTLTSNPNAVPDIMRPGLTSQDHFE